MSMYVDQVCNYTNSGVLFEVTVEMNDENHVSGIWADNDYNINLVIDKIIEAKPINAVMSIWFDDVDALLRWEHSAIKLLNSDIAVRLSSRKKEVKINGQSVSHDYLISNKLVVAMVEYTSNCNLKCVYCKVSGDDWNGLNMPEQLTKNITEQLIQIKPRIVIMHGHGETTMLPDWQNHASDLYNNGIKLSICSNLAKTYEDHELEALSKFSHISVSIDTVDPQLFKKLRRGGDIKSVIYNMMRIMAIAKSNNHKIYVSWSIVCCDKTIWGLKDLVVLGIVLGVDGFTLCNLTVNDMPKNAIEVSHVCELSVEDCKEALNILTDVGKLCEENHVDYKPSSALIDTLENKIVTGRASYVNIGGNRD